MGDGATFNGMDEGIAKVKNMTLFYEKNIQGYRGAIASQVGSVMCSYSLVNDIPMSVNKILLEKLKEDEGFAGFVISDYD